MPSSLALLLALPLALLHLSLVSAFVSVHRGGPWNRGDWDATAAVATTTWRITRCTSGGGVAPLATSRDPFPQDTTNANTFSELLTARLPTSVEDQVRQAAAAVQRAQNSKDGGGGDLRRQTIRLLLPLIGATELDDWPGGARQQMEAAEPLVRGILDSIVSSTAGGTTTSSSSREDVKIQKVLLDASEGVTALLVQAAKARDDAGAVLLPTAETVTSSALYKLDEQVGPSRTLLMVNPQWRRRTDFGKSIFGTDDRAADYVETFVPTFSLTSLICEGESIRVLRTYPGPWRVFRRQDNGPDVVDWKPVGVKPVLEEKPADWQRQPSNQRDGGILFNFGQPTYQEIMEMLESLL